MGLFDFDEIFFQQIKRTKKMVINQEIIDNIKRILAWQMVARQTGASLKFLECELDGRFTEEAVNKINEEK